MKTTLLIGGNSGVGYELASLLINEGAQVLAAARNTKPLMALGAETQSFDAESVGELVLPESLDGLVYCPGTIQLKPFHRITPEVFQKDMQINAFAAAQVIQQALPALKKSGKGSVVLFSSVAATHGLPFHASTSMAKAAVEGLTFALAAELSPTVRVNAIAPSLTDTPLASPLLNSDAKREISAKRHPLDQVGNPANTAKLAQFLLSDASGFITGQIIKADGGLSSISK